MLRRGGLDGWLVGGVLTRGRQLGIGLGLRHDWDRDRHVERDVDRHLHLDFHRKGDWTVDWHGHMDW